MVVKDCVRFSYLWETGIAVATVLKYEVLMKYKVPIIFWILIQYLLTLMKMP